MRSHMTTTLQILLGISAAFKVFFLDAIMLWDGNVLFIRRIL